MSKTNRRKLRGGPGDSLTRLSTPCHVQNQHSRSNGYYARPNGYLAATQTDAPAIGSQSVDSEIDSIVCSGPVDSRESLESSVDLIAFANIANAADIAALPDRSNSGLCREVAPTSNSHVVVPTSFSNAVVPLNHSNSGLANIQSKYTAVDLESLRGFSSRSAYSIGISFSDGIDGMSVHELQTRLRSWAQSEGDVDVEAFVDMMKDSSFRFHLAERIDQTLDQQYYYNTPTNGSCAMMLQAQLDQRWKDFVREGDVGVHSLQKSLYDISVDTDRENLVEYVRNGMRRSPDPECLLFAERIVNWASCYGDSPSDFPSQFYPTDNFTMQWNSTAFPRTLWHDQRDGWDVLIESSAVKATALQFTYHELLRIINIAPNFFKCDGGHYYLKQWCAADRVIPMIEEAFRDLIRKIVDVHMQAEASPTPARAVLHSANVIDEPEMRMDHIYNDEDVVPSSDCELASVRNTHTESADRFALCHMHDMNLLDLDFVDIGVIVGLSNSIAYIPQAYVKKTRRVFIQILEGMLTPRSTPDKLVYWKKWALLPTVLFSSLEMNRKQEYATRLDSLLNEDWTRFTIGYFEHRTVIGTRRQSKQTDAEQLARLGMKYAKVGEIGKVMQLITQERGRVNHDSRTRQQLVDKHPAPVEDCPVTDDIVTVIQSFAPGPDVEPIEVNETRVRSAVFRSRKLVSPGVDKLRYEHLCQLIGSSSEPREDEERFLNLLTSLVKLIVTGQCPKEFASFLRDNELFPAAKPKKPEDVRPIGKGDVLRKIASKLCLQSIEKSMFNEKHFEKLQYATFRNGTEQIIHSFRLASDMHPEWDKFAMDGDNAFQRISRLVGLHQTMHHFPAALPFLRSMYGDSSHAWYLGERDHIFPVLSAEGSHQGDVMGTWMFIMALHPFLLQLQQILEQSGGNGIIKFYVDDGNIAADFETMTKLLKYVLEEGPRYGFVIKQTSGSYLLGKCESREVALQRKNVMVNELGFSESIIHIHPDNCIDEPDLSNAILDYGMTVLGSYIGTDEFIRTKLTQKLEALEHEKRAIIAFPNLQVRNLLLRWCFGQKINYLQRTQSPRIMVDFVDEYIGMKKDILCSMFPKHQFTRDTLPDRAWRQACLHIKDGGLGLMHTEDIGFAAFLASVTETCILTFTENDPKELLAAFEDVDSALPIVKDFWGSLHSLDELRHQTHADVSDLTFDDARLALDRAETEKQTLQEYWSGLVRSFHLKSFSAEIKQGNDNNFVAWFTSLSDSTSGDWLEIQPKHERFEFSNSEFVASLCLRLHLPQESQLPGLKCSCPGHPTLDPVGIHLSTGCNGFGNFKHRHHEVIVIVLMSMLRYCGFYVKKEEFGCFKTALPHDNRRPDLSLVSKKMILDVRVAQIYSPTAKHQLTLSQASKVERAAQAAHKEKVRKYGDIASANGLQFEPMVFESSGRIAQNALEHIKAWCKDGAEFHKISKVTVTRYWLRALSCALQKSMATAVLRRSHSLIAQLSHQVEQRDFGTSREFVQNIDYKHVGWMR